MNILIDALPDTLEVNGKEYKIRTDFRDSLRALMACEDNSLTPQEKNVCVLSNVYLEAPDDFREAMQKAVWFLDGGRERDDTVSNHKTFSWSKDANLIYAAFRQTHNVDLTTVDLHWWQFLALFMDLGSDTAFCQLTSLRSRVKSGKATKEERQAAREMGSIFDVEDVDTRTLKEKDAEREFLNSIRK